MLQICKLIFVEKFYWKDLTHQKGKGFLFEFFNNKIWLFYYLKNIQLNSAYISPDFNGILYDSDTVSGPTKVIFSSRENCVLGPDGSKNWLKIHISCIFKSNIQIKYKN